MVTLWEKTQSAINKFRIKFQEDYLPSLREVHHWDHDQAHNAVPVEPKPGDVVLVKEEMQPRNQWKLGRIVMVRHGRDDAIRDVKVQLPSGHQSRRPISQLYPVECGAPVQRQRLATLFLSSSNVHQQSV